MAVAVEVVDLTKVFDGGSPAVDHIDLATEEGEYLVLLGPSGCGKTTLLRMIAGLEHPTAGEVRIDGKLVNGLPPRARSIAMVFQSYALYPHKTVLQNIVFPLKAAKVATEERKARTEWAAELLGLTPLLDRRPRQLSGGERQRVALARALVREPSVFLLDEPLSNLDAKLRVQTRTQLIKLHQRLQTTFVYVTHDQVEAMTMADRIAVMESGVLQQLDTPANLYEKPANIFVAGFIGSPAMNFFQSKFRRDDGKVYVDAGSFSVQVPDERVQTFGPYDGKEILLGMRPEDIHNPAFTPPGIKTQPVQGKVEVTELMGNEVLAYCSWGEHSFVARVDPRSRYHYGDTINLDFDMNNMHVFDRETEKAIR